MATIYVDAAAVQALGERLIAIGEALETTAAGDGVSAYGVGGVTATALDELLGGWNEKRLKLMAALQQTGEATLAVGARYARDEADVTAACVAQELA